MEISKTIDTPNNISLSRSWRAESVNFCFLPQGHNSPTETCANNNISLSVLLVEDTPIIQKVHTAMLLAMGYKVSLAATGQEALDLVSLNNFDVILMDIELPDMSGIQATLFMQKKVGQCLPVIALTTLPINEIEKDCLEVGINLIANKPITSAVLQELIIKVAGNQQKRKN